METLPEHPEQQRRWAREVLRRGLCELLYVGSNLAILLCGLGWLYRLLSHAPAAKIGALMSVAIVMSITCYHCARWRAGVLMSQQVEKFIACVIVTFGMALVWGAICCALVYSLLRGVGVAVGYGWSAGGVLGLCGFVYMVASDWSGVDDCLALPAAAHVTAQSGPAAA